MGHWKTSHFEMHGFQMDFSKRGLHLSLDIDRDKEQTMFDFWHSQRSKVTEEATSLVSNTLPSSLPTFSAAFLDNAVTSKVLVQLRLLMPLARRESTRATIVWVYKLKLFFLCINDQMIFQKWFSQFYNYLPLQRSK